MNGVKYHPDGLIFSLRTSNSIDLYSVENNKIIMNFDFSKEELKGLSFSENGYQMLSYSNDEVSLWDLRNLKKANTFKSSVGDIKNSEFDYSGSLITLSGSNGISILSAKTGKEQVIENSKSFARFQMNSRNEGYAITIDGDIYEIKF